MPSPTESVTRAWERVHRLPGGTWIFSRLLGYLVPYTGTIGAHVRELRPGHARLTLRDRRRVRQHLGSVHAVALINLGEATSGLAMLLALPPGIRSIVTGISAEFLKKARGTLTAVAEVTVPQVTGPVEHVVHARIENSVGEPVCLVHVVWRLDRPR
jgi:acyl-coenzyme A thioesterase PaaI-like protein